MGTFTNSEDPDEMPHNAAFRVYTVKVRKSSDKKIQYSFLIII